MPLFYFDTDDGDAFDRGDEGVEYSDPAAARTAALSALSDMTRDKIPDGDYRCFKVSVRDHAGRPVYTATLTLQGTWETPGVTPVPIR